MVNGAVLGFLVLGVGTKDGWTNSTQTSPNWFGRFYHKVNDVPEIWKMENQHQISIFHSAGCFV